MKKIRKHLSRPAEGKAYRTPGPVVTCSALKGPDNRDPPNGFHSTARTRISPKV